MGVVYRSLLSSKGQLVIPKELRDELVLTDGCTILMRKNFDGRGIDLWKENSLIPCLVCEGKKKIDGYSCFYCGENGAVPLEESAMEAFTRVLKYGKIRSVRWFLDSGRYRDGDDDAVIPEVKVESKRYSKETLYVARDQIQIKLIQEFMMVINGIRNYRKEAIDDICKLVDTIEAKRSLTRWLKGE